MYLPMVKGELFFLFSLLGHKMHNPLFIQSFFIEFLDSLRI